MTLSGTPNVINIERNEHSERQTPRVDEQLSFTKQKPQANEPEQHTPKTLNALTINAPLNLGHLGVLTDPEAKDPPEIVGFIHGQTARILLDSGCSTYVLDSNFAKRARILPISTKPVPIQLAVRAASQIDLRTKTEKLSMSIGEKTQTQKAFFILPLPRYDAILGIPFVEEFNVKCPKNMEYVTIDDEIIQKVTNLESQNQALDIAVVSRSRLKAISRRQEIDELYLASTRIVQEEERKLSDIPSWIHKEYGEIFVEGLPLGLPSERQVEHRITLHDSNLPPPSCRVWNSTNWLFATAFF